MKKKVGVLKGKVWALHVECTAMRPWKKAMSSSGQPL